MAGDGQVSLGQTVMKGQARKVRRIAEGKVVAGFAGFILIVTLILKIVPGLPVAEMEEQQKEYVYLLHQYSPPEEFSIPGIRCPSRFQNSMPSDPTRGRVINS